MDQAATPDGDVPTLHIRCGSDLLPLLRRAGFNGDYLEYSDPFCQGPVLAGDDWLTHRARFVTEAYGGYLGRDLDQIAQGLRRANDDLLAAPGRYDRIVLWFEHDNYDQLILARCLARFAEAAPRVLQLVQIDHYPGVARFVGLGQLPAEAFRLLWEQRRTVSVGQLAAGTRVWTLLRAADPAPLADAARAGAAAGVPDLPFMARALRRHCQEFPWLDDGLSLTERVVLRLLAERPCTMGEIFRDLMEAREPLPWLGDTMLRFILESMKRVDRPVFTSAFEGDDRRWFRERLTITDIGWKVLTQTVDFLSLRPPARYLGGAAIPGWLWDDGAGRLVRG